MRTWPCEICEARLRLDNPDDYMMTCPAAHTHRMCVDCHVGLRDARLLQDRLCMVSFQGAGLRRRHGWLVARRYVRPCPARLSAADLVVWSLSRLEPAAMVGP